MGAVNAKDVNDQSGTKWKDGSKEEGTNNGDGKNKDYSTPGNTPQNTIPPKFPNAGGLLGLPVSRVVLTFNTLDAEHTRHEQERNEKEKSKNIKSGLNIKIIPEEKIRTGKESNTQSDRDKVQKHEVAVQTEDDRNYENRSKTRITEVQIRMADSSADDPSAPLTIVRVKEEDSQGNIRYRTGKIWSDSELSRWTERSGKLLQGEKDGKRQETDSLKIASNGKFGKETTATNIKRVTFDDYKLEDESDAESKYSDGKSKWSISPHPFSRSSGFAEGLKRKIQGASLIKKFTVAPSKSDMTKIDRESEEDEREGVEEEKMERLGPEDVNRLGDAERNTNKSSNENNEGEGSQENLMHSRRVAKNDLIYETPNERNKELRGRCSDMGLCMIPNAERSIQELYADKKVNEERPKGLEGSLESSRKTKFDPTLENRKGSDEEHKNRGEISSIKEMQIKSQNSNTSEEMVGSLSEDSSSDESKVIPGREFSGTIETPRDDAMPYSHKSEVGEEKCQKLGEPSTNATGNISSSGQHGTTKVEELDIKDQTVMAVFDIEYFWRAKYAQQETSVGKSRSQEVQEEAYVPHSNKTPSYTELTKYENIPNEEKCETKKKISKICVKNNINRHVYRHVDKVCRRRNGCLECGLNNQVERQHSPNGAESPRTMSKLNYFKVGDMLQIDIRNESDSSTSVDTKKTYEIPQHKYPWSPEKKKNLSQMAKDCRIVNPPTSTLTTLLNSRKCSDDKCLAYASRSLMNGKLTTEKGNDIMRTSFSDSEAFERMKTSREIYHQKKGVCTRRGNRNRGATRKGEMAEIKRRPESQINNILEKNRDASFPAKEQNCKEENKMITLIKDIEINKQSYSWNNIHPLSCKNFYEKKVIKAKSLTSQDLTQSTGRPIRATSHFNQNTLFNQKSISEFAYDRSRNTIEGDIIRSKSDKSIRTNLKIRHPLADDRNMSPRSWAENEKHDVGVEGIKNQGNRRNCKEETTVVTEGQELKAEINTREERSKNGKDNREKRRTKTENESSFEAEFKGETNNRANTRIHERSSTFLTLTALASVAKNLVSKNSTKINSPAGTMEREESRTSMKFSVPKAKFSRVIPLRSTEAMAFNVAKTYVIDQEKANTKSNGQVSSSSNTSSIEEEQLTSAKASGKGKTKPKEAIHTKYQSSHLKTNYAVRDRGLICRQLKQSPTSKASYDSTRDMLDVSTHDDENKVKFLLTTSTIPPLKDQQEMLIDRNDKHAPYVIKQRASAKSTNSTEEREIPPGMKKKMQFYEVRKSKWGNMATQGPWQKRNVPKKPNKQIKPIFRAQKPVVADCYQPVRQSGSDDGAIETNFMHGMGKATDKDTDPSRESKPITQFLREPPNSEITRPVTSEPTYKVTGKPPICAAPRKQRGMGIFKSEVGAAQAAMRKVEEWHVTEAAKDGHPEGYRQKYDMAVDLETMQTRREEEFSTSSHGVTPTLQKEALSIGNGAECSNLTRKIFIEGDGNQLKNYSQDRLILENYRGLNEEIYLINDIQRSQSNTDGENNGNCKRMNMKKVSSKLSKMIENLSKLSIIHGNKAESNSSNEESNGQMEIMEEMAGQPNDEDGLGSKRTESVSVHFLRNPRPLSFSLTPPCSMTTSRDHSDGSTSEEVGATGKRSTSSSEISMHTADRLQEQIDVLMEKFLMLLDNVERMQEETEKKTRREEKDEERNSKRYPEKKEPIKNEGEEWQKLVINRPLPYHDMQMLKKPEETQNTSAIMRNSILKSQGEIVLSETSSSSKHNGVESKSGSSNSSTWSKMRIRSSVLTWCTSGGVSDHSFEQMSSDEDEKEDYYGDLIIENKEGHHQVRAAPRSGRIGKVANAKGKKQKKRKFWLRRSGKTKVDG